MILKAHLLKKITVKSSKLWMEESLKEPVLALLDKPIMHTCICYRPLMNEVNLLALALWEKYTHKK